MLHCKRIQKLYCFLGLIIIATLVPAFTPEKKQIKGSHIIRVSSPRELKNFFKYTTDRIPFISSHRGGPRKGMPENCIATFENTLRHTWSLIELDPHYTKDSAIVLMHDATLERTSNGKGKVSDYTMEEIRKLKLKDTEGNLTELGIPTLDEALEWSKGRTILIIDQKDVPVEVRVQKIREHKAQTCAMIMAYNLEDAKKCYALDPDIMMEVFINDRKAADAFEKTGIPWENIVAFVTHTEPAEPGIFEYLHQKGAMCIRGSSRTLDKDFTTGKITDVNLLNQQYRQLVTSGTDIIEADLGIEAGLALDKMQQGKSIKRPYFKLSR
jgi:glycerophosphoryl diester phosphodiesterase